MFCHCTSRALVKFAPQFRLVFRGYVPILTLDLPHAHIVHHGVRSKPIPPKAGPPSSHKIGTTTSPICLLPRRSFTCCRHHWKRRQPHRQHRSRHTSLRGDRQRRRRPGPPGHRPPPRGGDPIRTQECQVDVEACELLLGCFGLWVGGCGVAAGGCCVELASFAFCGAGEFAVDGCGGAWCSSNSPMQLIVGVSEAVDLDLSHRRPV